MDRYLFEKFVFELDDETYENACIVLAQQARNIVKCSNTNKVTFNYYPQEPDRLQLVAEGILDDGKVQIEGVRMHHAAPDVWKIKAVTSVSECANSYLATRTDGNGLVAVRLVNEHVLGDIESDRIIEAQMVAFAVNAAIYQDYDAYKNSTPPESVLMADGLVVATNFLVNNSTHLTEDERNAKEHCFDNLVDVCGTITMCYKYPLEMFGTKLNSYYIANIMTDFGQLKVIIAQPIFPKDMAGFGAGNVFVGKVLLSGDVCIYDYEKYASKLNNQTN